ncbi:PAS domain-containing protein [Hymenobacter fodinae]|uniref:histidine kinase n=1 Tax=Hymenobacter fodinae TaxID=2510796 RepID=A0A4Z0P6A7_9BACT|nr:PAS domain-containing protein [Hymenobacter fodinae]TGE06197.1 PAS domain S-box protein [Hymenobacter fodinae]
MDSLGSSSTATNGAQSASKGASQGTPTNNQELLELMPWGVLELAPDGKVTYLNAAAATLWGVPTQAALGHLPAQVHPAVLPAELLAALAQPGTPPADYWLPYSGQWIGVRTASAPNGQRWVFWDNVTARHQAEADRQRSHELLLDMESVAHTGSYEADLVSGSFYFSDGLYQLFGEAPQAFEVTLETIDARSHPDDVATVRRVLNEAIRTKQPYTYRRRIRRPDGTERTLEAHGEVRCDAAGNAVQLRGLVQDITERVQAEQALHESHELLRATIDSSLDMVQVFEAVRDEQGAVIDFIWVLNNAAAERYYGNVIGQHLRQMNPGVVEAGIFDAFRQVLETGVPDQREHHYVHEQFDGWFHQSTVKLGDGVTTTTHDITARKQAEQELRETKELLQATLDSSHHVVQAFKAVRDADGKIVDFTWLFTNQVWLKQYGGPMTGKSLLQENPGVVETGLFEKFVQVTETGVPIDHEQYYAHEQFNAWFHQTLVRMGDGFVMNTVEITERKQAELELQESKNLIQTVFDVSLNPIAYNQAVRDTSGHIIDFEFRLQNQQARRYTAADQVGKRYSEAYPGILDTPVFTLYSEVVETGHPLDTEIQVTLQGIPYWFHLLAAKLGDGLVASAIDITERKQAQEELISLKEKLAQQAQDRYHSLFHTMEEGVSILEMLYDDHGQPVDMQWVEVNPAFKRITGLTDVAGKRTSTVVPTEQYWLDAYDSVVKTGKALRYENYHAGAQQWYRTHTSRIGGPESRIVANVFEDITEHKRHEAQLRQAAETETFRLQLTDTLGPLADAVSIQEAATRLARQHFGADRCYYCEIVDGQVVIQREAATEGLPSVAGTYPLANFAVLKAGHPLVVRDVRQEESVDENLRQLCVQRQVISYLDVPVIKNGQPVGVLCLVQSTPREWTAAEAALAAEVAERAWAAVERARTEEALRAGEQRLRLVTNATPALIAYVDAGLRYRFINQRYQEWFGRAQEELRGQPLREVVGEEAFARLLPHAEAALAGQQQSFEEEMNFRTAGRRHVQTEFVPDVQPDGSVAGYYSMVVDITERKQQEQRQAFLLQFSDALRAEPTADAAANRALALLSEQLGLDRCYIAEYHLEAGHADILHQVGNDRVPPLPGGIRLSDFPETFRLVFDRTLVIDDFAATEGLSDTDRRNIGALGLRALVAAALRQGEQRPYWAIVAVAAAPRRWTPAEVALLEEATERTWAALERARAEAALRQSEEKFRTLFETIDEGFCVQELVVDERGQAVDIIYWEANAAFQQHTGLAVGNGKRASEVFPHIEPHWFDALTRVYQTGHIERIEAYNTDTGRWLTTQYLRIGHAGSPFIAAVFSDITERKRHEQRQEFLLQFSDALRTEPTADAVANRALHLLSEQLGLDRSYITTYYPHENRADVDYQLGNDRVAPLPAYFVLSDYPEAYKTALRHTVVIEDDFERPGLSETERRNSAKLGMRAMVGATLRKENKPLWSLVAINAQPRRWTPGEMALLEEVAERTWVALEQAKIEEELRTSEATLTAVFDALPVGIGLTDAHGRLTLANHQMRRYLPTGIMPSRDALPQQQRWYAERPDGSPLPPTEFPGARAQRGEKVVPGIEMLHTPAEGPPVWTQVFAVPLQHDHEKVTGHVTAILDIDAQKRAELQHAFLLQLSDALRPLSDSAEIETAGCRLLGEWLDAHRVNYVEINEAEGRAWVGKQYLRPGAASIAGEYSIDAFSWTAPPLRRGEAVVVADVYHSDLVPPDSLAAMEAVEQRAIVLIPLVKNGAWIGVLAVGNDRPRDWQAAEVMLARETLERTWAAAERARTEEALAASEQRLRALITNLPGAAAFVVGPDLRYQLAGGEALDAAGLEPADLIGRTVAEAMPPELVPQYEMHYRQALGGQSFALEHTAHGRTFISRGVPLLDLAGRPEAVLVVSYDITARKRAEEALQVSETKYRTLFETMDQGFGIGQVLPADEATGTPLDWQWLEVNPQFERLTGLPRADVLSQTTRQLIPGLEEIWYERYAQAAAGETVNFEAYSPVLERWFDVYAFALGPPDNRRVAVLFSNTSEQKQIEAALREAEARYRQQLEQQVAERTRELSESRDLLQSVFDTSLISMSVLNAVRDENGQIQDFRLGLVNKRLERETGRTDLVGRLYAEVYPGIRQVGIFDLMLRALATGEPQGMEYFYEYDGFNQWFACQFVQMGDGVVATNLDITERKTYEQERLKNLRLLEQAEAVAGLGSWDYDLVTKVMLWSDGMYQLFGLPVGSSITPQHYLEVVLPEDRPRAEQLVHHLLIGEGFEDTLRLQVHGQIKTVRMKAVVLPGEDGQPARVLGVDLDITELQRLEADNLRLRLTQQQTLFEAVQAAQETERKRMAESLHNGIGQILYATKLRLDGLNSPLLATDPTLLLARREAEQLLSEAIGQTRALSHELVPIVLEKFGLATALQDIGRKMSTPQLPLRIQVLLDDAVAPLAPALQMALYRMAQELAQNIVKHARGATEASLELETMPGWVLLRAEDNGAGFAINPAHSSGLGLRSIRDRVALLGGQVEHGSVPSGGAYVRIRIPLSNPQS